MTADEDEIIELHRRFGEAWSRGDSRGAASVYADDGVRVGARGDIQHGRAEVEQAFERLLHGPFEGASVRMGAGAVRMLGPDHALWQGSFEIVPSGGAALPGYSLDVMVRERGSWRVLESHPKLFPPQMT